MTAESMKSIQQLKELTKDGKVTTDLVGKYVGWTAKTVRSKFREAKCHDIFELAVKQKEFGNGRYARNLLEQAMMAQSKRITIEYKGKKITRKALTTLKAVDFEVNASKQLQKDIKPRIGFAV